MSKRQKTLGFFGFSKEITHRGKRVKIELPEDVRVKSKNVELFDIQKRNSSIIKGINLFAVKTILNMQQPK